MEERLKYIINHYGIDKQLKYIHTEYFELDEAILKHLNADYLTNEESRYSNLENIAGEIADIMVMLKQFQYRFGIPDSKIEEIMNYKIDRQINRINESEGQ